MKYIVLALLCAIVLGLGLRMLPCPEEERRSSASSSFAWFVFAVVDSLCETWDTRQVGPRDDLVQELAPTRSWHGIRWVRVDDNGNVTEMGVVGASRECGAVLRVRFCSEGKSTTAYADIASTAVGSAAFYWPADDIQVKHAADALTERLFPHTKSRNTVRKRAAVSIAGSASREIAGVIVDLSLGDQIPWILKDIHSFYEHRVSE